MAYTITTAGADKEFQTTDHKGSTVIPVDANHFLTGGMITGTSINLNVLEVNTTTYAVTTAATAFQLASGVGNYRPIGFTDIDGLGHYFASFMVGGAARGQVVEVNTSTYAISTAADYLGVGSGNANVFANDQMDANHFIVSWGGSGDDGFAQICEVNTTTWVVTTSGAPFEFDPTQGIYPCVAKIDDTHAFSFTSSVPGRCRMLAINTTTWAVTTAGATFNFDAGEIAYMPACLRIDGNHVLATYVLGDGANDDVYVTCFTINTSTWGLTETSSLKIADVVDFCPNITALPASGKYILTYGNETNLEAIVIDVDGSFNVTTDSGSLTVGAADNTGFGGDTARIDSSNKYLSVRSGASFDGFGIVLDVDPPAPILATIQGLSTMQGVSTIQF